MFLADVSAFWLLYALGEGVGGSTLFVGVCRGGWSPGLHGDHDA